MADSDELLTLLRYSDRSYSSREALEALQEKGLSERNISEQLLTAISDGSVIEEPDHQIHLSDFQRSGW